MAFWDRKEDDMSVQIKREVGAALDGLRGNTSDAAGIRDRVARALSGGYDGADTLHNVYLDYGYPQTITFKQFWNMYRRFGVAHNVVDLPVDTGWMNNPVIVGPAAFLTAFEDLKKKTNLFNRIQALDKRQRVGRYAGLYIRVRDNTKPSQPIETALNGTGAVIALTPIYEGQLRVSATESDPMSDDFGLPTMYEFATGDTGNRNENVVGRFKIHPSRIIIAAEGADNGGIYGTSSLEAPYNSLMDLRKIIGAGGEGFYKNAAQNVVFELTDGASAKSNEAILTKFNEAYDDFAANRMRRAMWTPGLKPTALESSLSNPKEFFQSALNDIAAAVKIPATILIGAQTGRLASSEDSKQYLSVINSRRENFMSELVRSVIDWFIMHGVLPAAEYEVEWDDLLAQSQADRLANAEKMSMINERQFKSGSDVPFAAEEIRGEAGFDPDDIPDEGEELDDPEQV